jgi:hypothetical protein
MARDWLISDVPSDLDTAVLDDQALGAITQTRRGTGASEAPLAVSMNDIVIHETHKWFGGADIRLDVLAVHGNVSAEQDGSWYTPTTASFPNVKDGARLNAEGMLVFFGWPRYFLDLFIIVSRDTKDADQLSELLRDRLAGDDAKGAVGDLLALVAAPAAAVVAAGTKAALTIGSIAYDVVSSVTTKSVGVWRTSWLEHTHEFGLGRHPAADGDSIRASDFSFWLDVRRDVASPTS